MNDEINYKANPLHGISLNTVLIEIVDHYGFDILYAYLNINCFKTNPSIDSSMKFLQKTDWAREKVEAFYMYEFKNLPRASSEQFELPPRDRIVPEHQTPGEPAELSMEDAERLREKRVKKAAEHGHGGGYRSKSAHSGSQRDHYDSHTKSNNAASQTSHSSDSPPQGAVDPWARARSKNK